jgi:hypothetical protein
VDPVEAQLERELEDWLECRLGEELPHLGRRNAGHLAPGTSPSQVLVAVEAQVREATRLRPSSTGGNVVTIPEHHVQACMMMNMISYSCLEREEAKHYE